MENCSRKSYIHKPYPNPIIFLFYEGLSSSVSANLEWVIRFKRLPTRPAYTWTWRRTCGSSQVAFTLAKCLNRLQIILTCDNYRSNFLGDLGRHMWGTKLIPRNSAVVTYNRNRYNISPEGDSMIHTCDDNSLWLKQRVISVASQFYADEPFANWRRASGI